MARTRKQKASETEPAQLPAPHKCEFLEVICEDGPVLAVNKPAGLLSQGAPQGVFCLADYVKGYLKAKYDKPGNVYLGVIHRLDRPVTGVVVFSRNSKGAARLSEQFRERQVEKTYLALLEQTPSQLSGTLKDYIRKIPGQARAEVLPQETAEAKPARLTYEVLGQEGKYTVVRVKPITGRTHQIRLQFASRGWPIVGDQLYGARRTLELKPLHADYTERIALHAYQLNILHPVRYDAMTITAPLPQDWPHFARTIVSA